MSERDFLSRWSKRKRSTVSDAERSVGEIIALAKPHLPAEDISNATDLLDHNEPGAALELVCTQLHEVDAEVEPELLNKIRQTCSKMGLPSSTWEPLDTSVGEGEEDEAALLERLGLPVPETLTEGDDFSGFMKAGVPEFLRKRALRRLWRSNPVLANLDGLNDYDEDFTSPEMTQRVLATAYQVGRGFVKKVVEDDSDVPDQQPEAPSDIEPQEQEAPDRKAEIAEAPDTAEVDGEELPPPKPRRMRFEA